jgi:hypothetical protein
VALAGGEFHFRVAGTAVGDAEEGEETGPGSEALVHGVGIAFGVGTELVV